MEFDQFSVSLLLTPAAAPQMSGEEEAELQDRHLDHLATMHEAGKIVAAGPALDPDHHYRGITIYAVGVEEARAIAEADPAVQAGRFDVVVMGWVVPAGAAHFTPTTFPHSAADVRR
jgi:uncharacterized protein YciI